METRTPDRATVAAFLGVVIFGGLNGVAVKMSNAELDPFWGAALRFGLASVVLVAVVRWRRVPLPHGQALVGSVLFGLVGFATAYALAYYGLVETPAGVAMVILALVPLLTLLLAVAHGLEKLRLQALAGSLLAVAGVALIFAERLAAQSVPLVSLLAVVGAALAIAETGVIVKRFPRAHPVSNNALAMAIGALVLLVVSVVAGETLALPTAPTTIAAVAYLIVLGSIALFMLYLFVIERWTASATSYSLLLMPLVAVVGGALFLDEPITAQLLVGGGLILLGVYLGAFASPFGARFPRLRGRQVRSVTPAVSETDESATAALAHPGCP